MKPIIALLAAIVLLFSSNTFAQNIQTSTIEWICTSTFEAESGTMVNEASRIVSSPEQIVWYDTNNDILQTLTIVGSEGSWNNVAHNGSIVFQVTAGDDLGIVTFYRNNSMTMIRIYIVQLERGPIYELSVSDANTL